MEITYKKEISLVVLTILFCFLLSQSIKELSNMVSGILIYTLIDILIFIGTNRLPKKQGE